ncbi:hypothetical protein EW026_g4077 [Hermanssonia centrifuga]|uniref:Carboxymuconolactone decarboxylase-like domain-containing protein n=1 Tax=Hermanssonia centrifuga TaxID=98765 RepID=A0A4S4KMW0_9APHY|nr:hypothetical protein EW026_g4077 [Hermanssonia centrifuga]
MANLATREFLNHLKSLYPQVASATGSAVVLNNPWYIIAAVAFGSSNIPDAVPIVFTHALEDLKKVQTEHSVDKETAHKEQLRLARRVREAVLKGGLLCGASRAINSLIALHAATPEDLCDTETIRDQNVTMEEYVQNGEKLFRAMYRDTADNVQGLLDKMYPDMGWFSRVVGYGITYGSTGDLLSQVEVSYILVAALISMDTPRQIAWHLANAQHGGATLQEAQAIRQITMEVAEKSGIRWKEAVPNVN